MWYKNSGNDNDVVLSSRVRLARNLSEYPFAEKLTKEQAEEIINKVKSIYSENDGWTATDMESLDEAHRGALVDKHLISDEFSRKKGPAYFIENDERGVYIMVLEEDHLRIQSVVAGLDLTKAADAVYAADDMLDKGADVAFSEKLGYITHCPTNLGTGMRASVMLHLPAYTMSGYMRSLSYELARMGFTIRGMDGEGSDSVAYIYQIANEATLGMSEEETISKLDGIVKQIVAKERELRKSLFEDRREMFTEKARRDIGVIMYSGHLTYGEMLAMYSEIRLCAAMGYLSVPVNLLDEMLVESMPDMLSTSGEDVKSPHGRDVARAAHAREIIGQVKLA